MGVRHGTLEGLGLTRVLVTGATGYLGGRLCRELDARPGTTVRALAQSPVDWLPAELVVDDLTRPQRLAEACEDVHAVVHLAGSSEVLAARDPERAILDTVLGTRHVAEAAVASGVERLVYNSTIHVYGAAIAPGAVITESTIPEPRSVYAIARSAAEHFVRAAATDAMSAIVFRLTNAVGAPAHPSVDRWSLVANDLCRQAVTTGSLTLRSAGLQWRDFVPLADTCRLLADAATGDVPAGTYNAGSGSPMTIRALAETIQDVAEARLGDRPRLIAPEPSGPPPRPYTVHVERLASTDHGLPGEIREALDETLAFCIEWKEHLER